MSNLILALVLLVAVATAAPYYPAGWVDLYQPPYQNNPTLIMSIACIQENLCYVPGMTNGGGTDIYTMDGTYNAPLVQMNMPGEMPVAIMGIAAGGTAENPHGVAGGPDILGGLKYLENKTTWSAPLALPFVALIGITADVQTGLRIAFPDLVIEGLWYSTDGGFEFAMKNTSQIVLPTSNCTWARFVANPTPDVIYMTYGNFPNSSKNSDVAAKLAEYVAEGGAKSKKGSAVPSFFFEYGMGRSVEMSGDGKQFKRHHVNPFQSAANVELTGFSSSSSSSSDNPDNHCPFSAAVIKSTDGGNTWDTVFSDLSNYYPNEIACASETHCAMVIEGQFGAGVMRTTDGHHFEKVFFVENTATTYHYFRTIAVSPVNSSLWFAGGTLRTPETEKGFVATSEDGGATWVTDTPLNFLAEVLKISITNDGVVYAAAESLFQAGTILRYTPNGPPATPAPAYSGDITQKVWATGDCSGAVNTSSFKQNACLSSSSGGSMTMACDMTDGVVTQNLYVLSNSCEGPYEQAVAPYGACLQSNSAGTVEFYCSAQQSTPKGTHGVAIAATKKH